MLKKLLISLPMCFLFAGVLFAGNIGSDFYGVYSETFPGAEFSGDSIDRVQPWAWMGWETPFEVTDGTAFEGSKYFRTYSDGGWGIFFIDSAQKEKSNDMSMYNNGTLELYIRSPVGVNVGAIQIGIKCDGADYLRSLSSLGYAPNGNWQKVTIELNSSTAGFANLTADKLKKTSILMMFQSWGNPSIDIDNIIWKKQGAVPPEPTVNIGNDIYGVYSNTISGASFSATNADRVLKVAWDWGGGDVRTNISAYEGAEYLQTGTAGGWGIHFSNISNVANAQDMSAYYNGSLELYIRVSTAATNYSNIKIGINTTSLGEKSKTFGELGYIPNGQWQKVSIPLNSAGFSGLTAPALSSTLYLLVLQNYGSDRIDIDNVVWRKVASEGRGNKATSIYGIYSEWVNGVQFGTIGLDNVALWSWDGSGPTETDNYASSFEGYKYFRSLSGSGGWGIFFVNDTQSQEVQHSMSEYFNGTLEFFIRAASGSNIGAVEVGIKYNSADNLKTLSSLGYGSGTGKWQKVSVPLNSLGFTGLTQAVMLESTASLLRVDSNGYAVDIDHVVWKKANQKTPTADISLKLKNRTDNALTEKFTWDNNVINSSTKIAGANQYIELKLSDWFPGDDSIAGWGLQIYTDNTGAEIKFTGSITTNTATGLVSTYQGESDSYLPMSWRVSDQLFPIPESSDPAQRLVFIGWMDPWSYMRDITADSSYYARHEYIRFCDKRGYKWSTIKSYGMLGSEKKLMIYLMVDFSGAKRGRQYLNDTITIELFYE